MAAADGPNPSSYVEIRNNLDILTASLDYYRGRVKIPCEQAAYDKAFRLRNSITTALNSTGLQWLWGSGYINLWRQLHRAQEELIQVQKKAEVIGDATVDYLCVRGSTIPNGNELLRELRAAAVALKPEVAPYFEVPVTPDVSPSGGAAASIPHKYARAVLKTIRYTLHDYRDEQRNGVLQVRNRILLTIIITEVVALLTLGLAITANADESSILAASAFFLIGTGLGLLYNRLYTSLETNSAVAEDYGLSMVRLWATLLFSGLAAVAGVLLIAVVPNVVDISSSTNPEGTPGQQIPPLREFESFLPRAL